MKPILFDGNATEFTTYGVGVLSDAVSCLVTEERNGEYELEMLYPVTGAFFDNIRLRSIIYASANKSGNQPFRVYKITKPISGLVTVYAQHISYDLNGIPVQPFTASGSASAMQAIAANSLVSNPFTMSASITAAGTMKVSKPMSARELLGGVEGSALDVFGGEYLFDGWDVTLMPNRGTDRGVKIRYGTNLMDMQQEENCAECYSGIVGFWQSADGELVQGDVQTIGTPGYTRVMVLDVSDKFEDAPTEDAVDAAALAYATANHISTPNVNLSVSYQQLEEIESVYLCDTVTVEFPEMGVSATAKVIKTEWDTLLDRYKSIEIGEAKSNLAATISQNTQMATEVPQRISSAVGRATSAITGADGGNVVIRYHEGKPYEILIMDTDNIETAQKVWRWNSGGLGYSSNGYDGDYGLAMTQDGEIVANFITTGTLSSADEKTVFDLDHAIIRSTSENDADITIGAGRFELEKSGASIAIAMGGTVSDPSPLMLASENPDTTTIAPTGIVCSKTDSQTTT